MATFGARKIASVASLTDHDRVYQFNRFSKISFISGADLLNTMYSDILGNSLGNDAVFVPSNVNMPAFSIISYLSKASNTDARTASRFSHMAINPLDIAPLSRNCSNINIAPPKLVDVRNNGCSVFNLERKFASTS